MRPFIAAVAVFVAVAARAGDVPPSWVEPVEPARIAGNLYYVGTAELGSYLLVDEQGLVLLDAPLEENAPRILQNVRALGFDPAKIRILVNSHAHFDHAGGFDAIRKSTGAKLYLTAPDAELAARGGKGDFAFGDRFAYPAVTADHIVRDGDVVRLGSIAMKAIVTPGHTRGCTTWQTTVIEEGKPLDVVFGCSLTAPGYRLVGNAQYPEIVDDYHRSIERLRAVRADIFLANHAGFFDLQEKLAKRKPGGANPFIVPGELGAYLDRASAALEKEIAKQKKEK